MKNRYNSTDTVSKIQGFNIICIVLAQIFVISNFVISYTVCQDDRFSVSVLVDFSDRDKGLTDTIAVSYGGRGARFVVTPEYSFQIASGEKRYVTVNIYVPDNTPEDIYPFEIYLRGNYYTDRYKGIIDVKKCGIVEREEETPVKTESGENIQSFLSVFIAAFVLSLAVFIFIKERQYRAKQKKSMYNYYSYYSQRYYY